MRAAVTMLIVAGTLAGCHRAPAPEGKGLALQNVQGVSAATLKKAGVSHVDPALMRLRSVSGAWSADVPGGAVVLQMNTLGTWSAQQLRGTGSGRALIGSAHGKYAFAQDGTVSATTEAGASGSALADLGAWSGGFSTSYGGDMLVRGGGGAVLRFSRSQHGARRVEAPRIPASKAPPQAR